VLLFKRSFLLIFQGGGAGPPGTPRGGKRTTSPPEYATALILMKTSIYSKMIEI